MQTSISSTGKVNTINYQLLVQTKIPVSLMKDDEEDDAEYVPLPHNIANSPRTTAPPMTILYSLYDSLSELSLKSMVE